MQVIAKAVVSVVLVALVALTAGSKPSFIAIRSSEELTIQAICHSILAAALKVSADSSEATVELVTPFASRLSVEGGLLVCASGESRHSERLPLPSFRFEYSFQGELKLHVSAEGGALSWWL